MTTHYDLLLNESESVGWPTVFTSDLTLHDRAILEGHDAPATFLWILRQCGTWLVIPMEPATGDFPGELVQAAFLLHKIKTSFREGSRFYRCAFGKLTGISMCEAKNYVFGVWLDSLTPQTMGLSDENAVRYMQCEFCGRSMGPHFADIVRHLRQDTGVQPMDFMRSWEE